MGQSASACKPSSSADPTADKVTFDATLLSDPIEGQKAQNPAQEEAKEQEAAEELRRKEGEAAQEKRRQDAEEKRLEEERLEKERRQAEEEEQRLAEEERARRLAEEARVRAEEEAQGERQRQERERVAEAERVKAEQARAVAAKERAEAAAAQKAVDDFLKARGFKQLSLPRKAFCGASVFPLHTAVEENNAEMVQAMVRCGADLQQKNSSNKIPLEVAEKCNKSGSHDLVVAALRGGA